MSFFSVAVPKRHLLLVPYERTLFLHLVLVVCVQGMEIISSSEVVCVCVFSALIFGEVLKKFERFLPASPGHPTSPSTDSIDSSSNPNPNRGMKKHAGSKKVVFPSLLLFHTIVVLDNTRVSWFLLQNRHTQTNRRQYGNWSTQFVKTNENGFWFLFDPFEWDGWRVPLHPGRLMVSTCWKGHSILLEPASRHVFPFVESSMHARITTIELVLLLLLLYRTP